MKKVFVCLCLIVPVVLSCSDKKPNTGPIFNAERTVTEQPDTSITATSEQIDPPIVEEKKSVHASPPSTSRSHKSGSNDNMRGFDPASEDDMDDNGMSRYMENNDEEGWD